VPIFFDTSNMKFDRLQLVNIEQVLKKCYAL